MPGDCHCDPFRDSRTDQISDCGAAEVVNESFSGNPGLFASPLPRLVERQGTFTLVVEDPGAGREVFSVFLPLLLKYRLQDYGQGDDSPVFILGCPAVEMNRTGLSVYAVPREGEYFALHAPGS